MNVITRISAADKGVEMRFQCSEYRYKKKRFYSNEWDNEKNVETTCVPTVQLY